MLCVIALSSVFWSLKMMVSTLQLVISILIRIHVLCLQLTMLVMTTTVRSILVPMMQITMSLIVQCVFSTQMERVEQNQQHTLFQTK
jgi:hypothetical protein